MPRVRIAATTIVGSVMIGFLLALVVVLIGSSRNGPSMFDLSRLLNVAAVAVFVSLPISLLGGVAGAVLIVRNWPDLDGRSVKARTQWGLGRGFLVGFVVTAGYFLAIGGVHSAVPMLAALGGVGGAAAGGLSLGVWHRW